MNKCLYRLFFMAVGICIVLAPTAQAQFAIDAYIEAPQGGPLTATCAIEQSSNEDYYGQIVSTCVLYGPNNSEDSCSASTNVYDSNEAECTITVNNPASGEYQVNGEFYTNNWFDQNGDQCDSNDPYLDPLDFEGAEVNTWNGLATLYGG